MDMDEPANHINQFNHTTDKTVSVSLPDLPTEIKYEFIPSFSLNLCGLFAQTSADAEKTTAFLRLLPSAVDAEPESYQQEDVTKLASISILKRHPELLFQKGMVTDHAGRKIRASPYQLFLGTGDVWAIKQVHDIIIPMLPEGATLAKIQYRQQFPNSPWPPASYMNENLLYDNRNIAQIARVIELLRLIVTRITADPCTNGQATLPETLQAVASLRQLFTPREDEVIKSGLHFPFAIMQEIYKVYKDQFDNWKRNGRLAFYSREVIGAAEAALSAVDGQCCKNGIGVYDLLKGPNRNDGLFCRHPKGIPQELAPVRDKLGGVMFVEPFDGHACVMAFELGFYRWYNKTGHAYLFSNNFRVSSGGKYAILWFEHHMNNKSNEFQAIFSGKTKITQQNVSREQTQQRQRP